MLKLLVLTWGQVDMVVQKYEWHNQLIVNNKVRINQFVRDAQKFLH